MAYTTIPKPSAYFNTLLYSGNLTARSLTEVGFEPSFVWIKERTSTSAHMLFDQPRGVNKYISSNLANVEATASVMLSSFDSDGFSLGNGDDVNDNGQTYASWNWKANGAGSSNTAGSINTTKTSANTTSGCSIIKYTGNGSAGATIGHGMGIKPSMIIIKNINTTQDWIVYTQSLTATKILYLNSSGGFNDNNVFFNDVEPTTSLITLGSNSSVNGSGNTHIAYCFSNVQGYSSQGSYVGNGNADGTFVYTGFKPAWIMIKQSSASGRNWEIYDSKRIGYNVANYRIPPNTAGTEETNVNIDIISNGFKARSTDADVNASGATYIYMAFAEEPLVSTNGVPATAR